MWDGKPFLQVPHEGRDDWRKAHVHKVGSGDLFGAAAGPRSGGPWCTLNESCEVKRAIGRQKAALIPERIKISSPETARFPEAELGIRRAKVCHFASCRKEHATQKTMSSSVTKRPGAGSSDAPRRQRRFQEPRGWI